MRLTKVSNDDKTLKDGKPANPTFNEVPQILVQRILQYQDNPTLESYTGFTAIIRKTTLLISMATMSQPYLEQLCKGKEPSERFNFWHSKPFDLLEPSGRREALRLIVGAIRYLATQKVQLWSSGLLSYMRARRCVRTDKISYLAQ